MRFLLAGQEFLGFLELQGHLGVARAAEGVAVFHAGLRRDGLLDVGAEERRELLKVLEAHVLEVDALFDAVVHGLAGDGVRLAERHALLHEIIREVRGVGEVLCHRSLHDFLAHFHAADNLRVDGEAELDRVDGVKDAFLVLLQILVVGERQALDRGEHGHEMADHAACLSAHELGDIRVLLLRHHRGARAVRIIELHEMELARAPEDGLLAETREMHHEDAGCAEELEDIVAVAHRIEAVVVDMLEMELLLHELPVDGERRARERARAQRHDIAALIDALEAGEVAREHAEIRQQMMAEGNRLCPLQMRIARHDDVRVLRRGLDECLLQIEDFLLHGHDFLAHIHMRVQRHLIVAAARRMQAAARLADGLREPLLDIHMDIFEVHGKVELAILDFLQDIPEARDNLILVRRADDAALREHRRVGDGARDILVVHALVKTDGGLELVDHLIGALREAASPHRFAHLPVFSCMSARTFSGRPKRLMKPVASAWL